MFYANMSGEQVIVEVLLNNEPWRAGEETVRACNWEKKDGFYSARLFWMLEPISE